MIKDQRHVVVGSGSIARRHIANLKTLFPNTEVACVSTSGRPLAADETGAHRHFDKLTDAICWAPSFAVVASPAPWHAEQAALLASNGIAVLIEKPLASALAEVAHHREALFGHRDKIAIGYNLRHLSSAIRFKALLEEGWPGRIHGVNIEVGQYLPDWRPGTDYRGNVSAQRRLGGGALLELSHEFDYLIWLVGRFDTAYCHASISGALDIDVEDRVDAIVSRRDGLVANIHLDFLQRSACRTCKVISEHGNLVWNLLRNRIDFHGPGNRIECLFDEPEFERNAMYLAELQHFARVVAGEARPVVDLESAWHTLRLIDALKRSAESGQAVSIEEGAQ